MQWIDQWVSKTLREDTTRQMTWANQRGILCCVMSYSAIKRVRMGCKELSHLFLSSLMGGGEWLFLHHFLCFFFFSSLLLLLCLLNDFYLDPQLVLLLLFLSLSPHATRECVVFGCRVSFRSTNVHKRNVIGRFSYVGFATSPYWNICPFTYLVTFVAVPCSALLAVHLNLMLSWLIFYFFPYHVLIKWLLGFFLVWKTCRRSICYLPI